MKILVQDQDGVRELEEGYASEHELQVFLRDHSDLIPVDEIELGTPPLLCIGFEVFVPGGAEDLLYVDETGLLTLVETKLRRNQEARREVVGQVLEYAAQTAAWSPNDFEAKAQQFLARQDCPREYQGLTLEQALRQFWGETNPSLAESFSYLDFLDQVSENLADGRIRLIIAIDEPPPVLLKTVEFVNRFSQHFDIYLIQLKRFYDSAREQNIFVPALFGQVPRSTPSRPAGRIWDRESFLQQATERNRENVPVLESLIDLAEGQHAIIWGRGAKNATFTFGFIAPNGKSVPAFYAMSKGAVGLDFASLSKAVDDRTIATYRDSLALAREIPPEAISTNKWKEFDVLKLASEDAWNAFKGAVLALKQSIEHLSVDEAQR